jgi:hypothetical protein
MLPTGVICPILRAWTSAYIVAAALAIKKLARVVPDEFGCY